MEDPSTWSNALKRTNPHDHLLVARWGQRPRDQPFGRADSGLSAVMGTNARDVEHRLRM